MIREQRMMMEIAELGNKFDDYIIRFNEKSMWRFIEKECVINDMFREIVDIFANYNLTSSTIIFKDTYKLMDNNREEFFGILSYLMNDYLKRGSDNILNRVILLCFLLHVSYIETGILPSKLLNEVANEDIITIRKRLITKIKYRLGKVKYPCDVLIKRRTALILCLLIGIPLVDLADKMLIMEGHDINLY